MEVFTFLKMTESSPSVPSRPGADGADRIDVIAIAGKDGIAASQGQARQQIAKEFKNFNAAKAQCFKVEDRERLLAVIEAGFGDFKEFNELVRDVFKSRLEKSRLGTQELHSASAARRRKGALHEAGGGRREQGPRSRRLLEPTARGSG